MNEEDTKLFDAFTDVVRDKIDEIYEIIGDLTSNVIKLAKVFYSHYHLSDGTIKIEEKKDE